MTSRLAHAAPEVEVTTAWRVACDGSEGALGHPRVWLSIDRDTGWVECGYCDKRFVHEDFKDEIDPAAGPKEGGEAGRQ